MRKEIKKYIETELKNYHKTKKELGEIKYNIITSSPLPPDGMPRSNTPSNPTLIKTEKIFNDSDIVYMEEIINAIDKVFSELDKEKQDLIKLKYWQKNRRLNDIGIAIELNISKTTVHYWRNEICKSIAVELGLIEEENKYTKQNVAREALKVILSQGDEPAKEVYKEAAKISIEDYNLRRVKNELGIKHYKVNNRVYWSLPDYNKVDITPLTVQKN